MRILFTGAGSFTGMWLSKQLARASHEVAAVFPRPFEKYEGLRKERVDSVLELCLPVFDSPFGSEQFLAMLETEGKFDMLCHHAADVYDYRNPNFNFSKALENNTKNIKEVLTLLQQRGCQRVLLTGSVFEQKEGKGTDNLRAVSPYGLSKGLTSDTFQFFTSVMEMKLGKFVIPNPFGPYEEPRFTSHLARSWFEGKVPTVSCPKYVRDNIHVSLLAKAYVGFAEQLTENSGFETFNPSGYCECQGDFTERFSREIGKRLSIPCPFTLDQQVLFPEPKVRVNTDALDSKALQWDESRAWDQLAAYYMERYGS
ncbi:MAG: NAD(P)-dependent oxidoreductase [Waddliaceae bacterium]